MKNNLIIDSNIIIDLIRGKEEAIEYIDSLSIKGTSIVITGEIIQGARNKAEQNLFLELIEQFNVKPLTEEIGNIALDLVLKYNLKDGLFYTDSLIAATCIATNSILVTNDKRHFKNIKEIEIINPY